MNEAAEVPEVREAEPCSNPGCDQPGTNACSACKTTLYCGPICQTANWPSHKEECDGHLRKVGLANLKKCTKLSEQQNWAQALHHGEIAATKLKQLKDRRLETVEQIDLALNGQMCCLASLNRHKEAMKCAEECYTLWAMYHIRNPLCMEAALALIDCCLHNKEFEDSEHYARHAMFMINDMNDNFIPSDQRSEFLARGSYYLSQAIQGLAKIGGIATEEKRKAGEEAITLARQALKIHTQLHGIESADAACDMSALADALEYFNNVDDDEVLRLYERAIENYRRVGGTIDMLLNIALSKYKLGSIYKNRAQRAHIPDDLDRCVTNLELSIPHFLDAAQIYRANNHGDDADTADRAAAAVEEKIRLIRIARAAAEAAASATTG